MKYYLAGAIDFEKDSGASWRDELKKLCKSIPRAVFFDPVLPYSFNSITIEAATYIHNINMVALREADCIVARIVKGQTVVGTPIEIYDSVVHHQTIILITDMVESVYIRYMSSKSRAVVGTIQEAYDEMIKFEECQLNMVCHAI